MNKYLSILVAGLLAATSAAALAADNATANNGMPSASQSITQSQQDAQGETLELKNGTKIQISEDGTVNKVNSDGSQSAIADGKHKLSDGSVLKVKNGKKVIG